MSTIGNTLKSGYSLSVGGFWTEHPTVAHLQAHYDRLKKERGSMIRGERANIHSISNGILSTNPIKSFVVPFVDSVS